MAMGTRWIVDIEQNRKYCEWDAKSEAKNGQINKNEEI